MPFNQRFLESGEDEFIDKLFALVDRDMKDTLDGIYGADVYPDFAAMLLGEPDHFVYPLLVASLDRMESLETDDGFYLNQTMRVGLGLAVKDTALADAKQKATKYVRALKTVIRGAESDDLFPDSAQLLNHTLDISHRYLRHGTDGTDVIQPVEIELRIGFGEK